MFRTKGFYLVVLAVLLFAAIGYPQNTQLRYLKTTDFGATWTGPTQAGDVSALNPTTSTLADFSAIAMNNDELCYAVFLPGAPTPGVYAFPGPSFAPVLIMAEGSNDFGGVGSGGRGWSTIGKTTNGDLFVVIWGADATGNTSLWGAKSTNNGASWISFLVGAEPTLPAGSIDFHISDLNHPSWCFVVFHDANAEEYVLRFPTSGGAGTFVDLGTIDGSAGAVSYYIGQCKPIAYDVTANALFVCFRNADLSGTAVYYSGDAGATFSSAVISGAQRYPSMALRMADQTPFVISNVGVPAAGARHWSWYSYDELGYNGGSWTPRDTIGAVTYEGPGPLLYVNQAYFWDATHGIASQNLWGASTPEGVYTSRTQNGGTIWTDFTRRWQWEEMTFDPGSCSQNEIVGAGNGVGYVIFCARVGAPDTQGHEFSNFQLLTSPTTLGPYVLSAYVSDPTNNVDPNDNHITYWINTICADTESTSSDSSANLDPNNNGTFYFTIPSTICGHALAQGDTVWYHFWGRDGAGNAGMSYDQAIVAGIAWLDANNPVVTPPTQFALHANYPNPFNPETQIKFDLAASATVTLNVYNSMGQLVRTLVNHSPMGAGQYSISFNGSDLPSGVYLYRLTAGSFSETRKMMLVK